MPTSCALVLNDVISNANLHREGLDLLIAHTSDFHIFANKPETSLVRPDAADAARKVVDDMVTFSPHIDAVMITGDLADGGSTEDYELVKDILSPIKVPIFAVPGNHDARIGFQKAFKNQLPFLSGPKLDYVTICGNVRIIALDTLIEGQIYGGLDDEQISWLAALLAETTDLLTVILMHHPAFPSAITKLDQMALQDGYSKFEKLISSFTRPLRILSGHIHRPYQTLWNGVWCAVSGGPSFQHALTMDRDAPEPLEAKEPFSYFIHKIEETATMTVHTRYVEL